MQLISILGSKEYIIDSADYRILVKYSLSNEDQYSSYSWYDNVSK